MRLLVTTGDQSGPGPIAVAKELAAMLDLPYVPRDGRSVEQMRLTCNTENILVVTKKQIQLIMAEGTYFFHIGMAKLRIKNMRDGKYDHMVSAMALCPGDRVLDCTLGLGTDAVVASYIVGKTGQVWGLESEPVVAELVRRGLLEHDPGDVEMKDAMERIKVINNNYLEFLQQLPARSFDVVYFDPMFRRPVTESSGIASLRPLANHDAVPIAAVQEAKRVARRRVVLKEAANSREFERLGFYSFCGGKYSSIGYGYIETEEGE